VQSKRDMEGKQIAIVGASIGGLAAANVLTQLGASVTVLEQYESRFEDRGGGMNADVPLYQSIRQSDQLPLHNMPQGVHLLATIRPDSGITTVLYGDAWRYLYEGLPDGVVKFGVQVDYISDPDTERPGLIIGDVLHAFDLIVLADGGWSQLRRYVTTAEPVYSGRVVWRTSLDLAELPEFSAWGVQPRVNGSEVNAVVYGVRSPTDEITGVMINSGVGCPQEMRDPCPRANRQIAEEQKRSDCERFVGDMEELFGKDSEMALMLRSAMAKGRMSCHPTWEFAAPRMTANRLVLLGDCAHMGSPGTGSGAKMALRDADTLRSSLLKHSELSNALNEYNEVVLQRAVKLLTMSQAVPAEWGNADLEKYATDKLSSEREDGQSPT